MEKISPTVMLILVFISSSLYGQRQINQSIPLNGNQSIELDFQYADVTITTWQGQDIELRGTVSINDGENDDAFTTDISKDGAALSIKTFIKGVDQLPRTITVVKGGEKFYFRKRGQKDKEVYKIIKEELGEGGYTTYSEGVKQEIDLAIKIPAGKKVRVTSEYGNLNFSMPDAELKAQNTYGHIVSTLDQNSLKQDIDLRSTYSFVDVSIPANSTVNVDLDSDYGKIFTDLDFQIDPDKSTQKSFANHIVGKLNKGGNALKLKATYKNIYLRKAQ